MFRRDICCRVAAVHTWKLLTKHMRNNATAIRDIVHADGLSKCGQFNACTRNAHETDESWEHVVQHYSDRHPLVRFGWLPPLDQIKWFNGDCFAKPEMATNRLNGLIGVACLVDLKPIWAWWLKNSYEGAV